MSQFILKYQETVYGLKDSDYLVRVIHNAEDKEQFVLQIVNRYPATKTIRSFRTKKDLKGYIWSIENGYRSLEELWNGEEE